MSRAASHVTTALLTKRARALKRHVAGAVQGEAVSVHQARVASRRLREAVPVLAAGLKGADSNRTLRRIRKVTRALGRVRELDVTLALIDELATREDLPPDALAALRARVERERSLEYQHQVKPLSRLDMGKLRHRLTALARALDAQPTATWRAALATRIVERSRALAGAARQAGQLYDADRLHQVRIAVKKLRYTMELARESGASAADAPARVLEAIQNTLGRLHDLQILQAHVAAAQAEPSPRAADSDLDAITQHIEAECRHVHARYLSMTPGLDSLLANTRAVAAGLARGSRVRTAKAALGSATRAKTRERNAAGATA